MRHSDKLPWTSSNSSVPSDVIVAGDADEMSKNVRVGFSIDQSVKTMSQQTKFSQQERTSRVARPRKRANATKSFSFRNAGRL